MKLKRRTFDVTNIVEAKLIHYVKKLKKKPFDVNIIVEAKLIHYVKKLKRTTFDLASGCKEINNYMNKTNPIPASKPTSMTLLVWFWASVADGGRTFNQCSINTKCKGKNLTESMQLKFNCQWPNMKILLINKPEVWHRVNWTRSHRLKNRSMSLASGK